ncbi:MAG: alpha-2-macroglobulin family protein [bacterium]|nr:alpha-2-macroglobulin family protein [bacterium]
MNKEPRKISLIKTIISIVVLYIIAGTVNSLYRHNIPDSFLMVIIIIHASPVLTLLAMMVKRLITTLWGNFVQGLLIFLLLGGILLIPAAFIDGPPDDALFILVIKMGVLGIVLFQFYDRFFLITGEKREESAEPGLLKKAGLKIAAAARFLLEKIKSLFAKIKEALAREDGIFNKIFSNKKTLKISGISAGALVLVFVLYKAFIAIFCVTVIATKPIGEVPLRANIVVDFSEPIVLPDEDIVKPLKDPGTEAGKETEEKTEKNADTSVVKITPVHDLVFIKPGVDYFKITPALKGTYRFEDNKSIIFIPDRELSPSTIYTVDVQTDRMKADKPFILSKSFSFNTPKFAVKGTSLFYNYDLLKNLEKEVVGEINFNAAVDIKELVKYISMDIEGDPVSIKVEPSNIPTRFYIKSGKIERRKEGTNVVLRVKEGLPCMKGKIPLEKEYEKKLRLPETEKLQVVRVETCPVEGSTFISVLFNRPVSPNMIRKHVSITSEEKTLSKYTVETEYCYAILKYNFKPNENYWVTISEGMRSKTGEELVKSHTHSVFIEDLKPRVRFASRGSILPLKGHQHLQVHTVNLDKFNVKIEKVYRNNLVHFLRGASGGYGGYGHDEGYGGEYYGRRAARDVTGVGASLLFKTVEVTNGKLNQKVPHYIGLKEFHNMDYKGLFSIRLSDTNEEWNHDQQYILCTDLGLMAKHSGNDLIVKVYSIMGLTPVAGAVVKILSHESQVMRKGVTSGAGECVLKDWKVSKEKFKPFLLVAEQGDDYSFLEFDRTELNSSRFNTGGKRSTGEGLNAFITPERGVYRPGDKAYITAIVRRFDLAAAPPVDAQLYISDPLGEKFRLVRKKIPAGGMIPFEISIPSYAKTGRYSIALRLNEDVVIGRSYLKVEEFIPDKIKAEIEVPKKRHTPGEAVTFTVKGTQLFGPPAADRKVVAKVRFLSRSFRHPLFKGYSFVDREKRYDGEFIDLGEGVLDSKGKKTYTVEVPGSIQPPSALTARIYTEVFDTGGRPVSAAKSIDIDHYPVYVGLKVRKQNIFLKKRPVDVSYVAIDPKGRYKNIKGAKILVKHKVYYTILKKYGWFKKKYKSESYEEVIYHKEVDINSKGSFRFTPKAPGEYTIYISQDMGMNSSKTIYVQGPDVEMGNLESAENLVIEFNKEKYAIGDIATVNIHSPIPGRLFFSLERNRVLASKSMMLVNNKATISFPVEDFHAPNVYVSALVVRKPTASMRKLPMTSMGIKNMEIDPGNRKIALDIESAAETRSRDGLRVRLKATPGADVVLTAVDEGILQITQFRTPDPFNFFYAKRALETRLFSIFDAILPNLKAKSLAIGGGDDEMDTSRRHINPVQAKRVKAVSLYSGVLKANAEGYVNHHFKIPEFNGRVRVMALAANSKRFGSASKYVTVADPIVITASYPRMLAPGDTFDIPVDVYNKTGKWGKFKITLNVEGPVKIKGKRSQVVSLGNRAQKKIYFRCVAENDAGKAVFILRGTGNGETGKTSVELPVRPARTLTTVVEQGSLKPGESAAITVPGGFIKYGQRVRFAASPKHIIRFLGGLDYLIRYPYGCAEQTTSKVFPLIYFKELIKDTGLLHQRTGAIDYYISEGIKKLEGMQRANGSFSYWPGGSINNDYTSQYVSHFLLEANRLGFAVDPKVIAKIKNAIGAGKAVSSGRLDRRRNYSWRKSNAYGLYLKALAGSPDLETMRYVRKNKLKDLNYTERCRLASAFAFIGDKETAKKILPSEFAVKYFPRQLGGSFDSVVRRLSIYLKALCEVDPSDQRKYSIAREIAKKAVNGRFANTQDNVFALMALAKTYEGQTEEKVNLELLLNGKPYKTMTGGQSVFEDPRLSGKKVTLKNKGDEKVFYNLMAEGTLSSPEVKPASEGLDITRNYYTSSGSKLNLSNVEQGELIVVTLTIKPTRKNLDNLVVVDMLPAGFEIENLRLRSRGDLGYEPPHNWIGAYEDIRDDRLILFTGAIKHSISYSYTVRAVSVGTFIIPQAYAEAMYDPEVHSVGRVMGKVHVVRSNN